MKNKLQYFDCLNNRDNLVARIYNPFSEKFIRFASEYLGPQNSELLE